MMEYFKMSDISEGQTVYIEELRCDKDIKQRLMDLGFVKGTKIQCVLTSPFHSMKAYGVRGSIIALRKDDAEKIIVRGR